MVELRSANIDPCVQDPASIIACLSEHDVRCGARARVPVWPPLAAVRLRDARPPQVRALRDDAKAFRSLEDSHGGEFRR